MKEFIKLFSAASALTVVSGNVMAADATDYTVLTSAIDFSSAGVAILAVAALVAVLYAIMRCAKLVLSVIRA